MAHRYPVGDSNRVETPRHTSARIYAITAYIGLGIEGGVARCRIIARRGDTDEGAADFLLGQAHGVIIAAVRRAFRADRNMTAGQF